MKLVCACSNTILYRAEDLRPRGFEPPTFASGVRRSNPLSYGRSNWRRGRDSNPRTSYEPVDGLANRCLGPLDYPSVHRHSTNTIDVVQPSDTASINHMKKLPTANTAPGVYTAKSLMWNAGCSRYTKATGSRGLASRSGACPRGSKKVACPLFFGSWRRGRDSNPRSLAARRFSRPVVSSARPPLQAMIILAPAVCSHARQWLLP